MVESQSTLNSFCHQPSFQIIPHKKVSARKLYISRTVSVQSQKLFLHPKSRWELNASSVAFWLLKLSSSCSRMPFVRLMIRENFSTRLLGVEEFQLKKLCKRVSAHPRISSSGDTQSLATHPQALVKLLVIACNGTVFSFEYVFSRFTVIFVQRNKVFLLVVVSLRRLLPVPLSRTLIQPE